MPPAVAVGDAPAGVFGPTAAVAALLVAQPAVVRPGLNRRSDRVLAGGLPDHGVIRQRRR
ncbi:hypothetical protein KBP30_06240 [Streptomyces sp. Go40/10]|uniref:hypothetical protein n=1 Tax=Streptomyces sp. Go40/10 TaxID=2825844 RepID=UPI001E42CD56|nr:hypothetical protein [Streptomyces sp. Go40/10]UFR07649.1 hypothetical protein KBP30_06240 [Streptomyces sp. Go40/10]